MSPPKRFQINAKNYFLTYPQCSITKEHCLDFLLALNTPTNKLFIKICRELHEDGEPHLHVLIQFEGKFKCTNQRLFDIQSPNCSKLFHPNVQGAKSSSDVKSYIDKDGDTLQWGNFQIDGRSARGGCQTANDACAKALNANSVEDAMQIIKEQLPRDFIFLHHHLKTNLVNIFQKPIPPYTAPFALESFDKVPNGMVEWFHKNVKDSAARPLRPISIIIEGDSRTGKTMWARSLGPHNYICGHMDLSPRVYSNNAWYNIVDDVDPHYVKHLKELMGAQHDWQSNTKYGRPIQIKGGIPTIFLCNQGPTSSYKEFFDEEKNSSLKRWALKNAEFFFLEEPLYSGTYQSSASSREEEEGNSTQTN